MSIFWNIFFWLALVAVAGIIAVTVIRVVNRLAEAREHIADAANGGNYKELAERGTASSAQVASTLTSIEERLAGIEKTLTDIP